MQSFGIAISLTGMQAGLRAQPGSGFVLMTMLTLTTGHARSSCGWASRSPSAAWATACRCSIFAGIVVGLPRGVARPLRQGQAPTPGARSRPVAIVMLLAVMIAVVAFIVYVERSERRIPVQYAKRVVGRKVMGGQSTHLPLRVNAGGVMPVIFASSILDAAADRSATDCKTIAALAPMIEALRLGRAALYVRSTRSESSSLLLLRVDRLQPERGCRQHAEVWRVYPGIRPGKRTADYINEVLTRITLVGALYLDHHLVHSGVDDHRDSSEPPAWLAGGGFFEKLPTWMTQRTWA